MKFADPVKGIIAYLLEWVGLPRHEALRYVDGDLKEECPPGLTVSARHLLQTFGTDWARNQVSDDIWLRIAAHRIDYFLTHGYGVVVDDVRFPNEVDLIRRKGGVVIRVDRPGFAAVGGHEAERSLTDLVPDAVIDNSGSLSALRWNTEFTLTHLRNFT